LTVKIPTLREKIKKATLQEILAAAEIEIAQAGLSRTSMSAIARRAAVSVGTLYNYFSDKELLLSTLLSTRRNRLFEVLEESIAKHYAGTFEVQLERVVSALFDFFDAHRNFVHIVLASEALGMGGPVDNSSVPPIRKFSSILFPLTTRGVKEGFLNPEGSKLYPSVLVALVRSVLIEGADDEVPFRHSTPFVLRTFLYGTQSTIH
jgi:AcrR family transcriptional regulator